MLVVAHVEVDPEGIDTEAVPIDVLEATQDILAG